MSKKEPTKQTAVRLKESSVKYMEEVKEKHQLSSMSKTMEMIIAEHRAATMGQNENIANLVVEKIDEKYGKALTRIRLGANAADVNSQVMIEILNSFIINNTFDIGEFVSTSSMKSATLEEAQHTVKSRIAYYKQLKDNKKKENEEK